MVSPTAPRVIEGRHHPLVKELRSIVRSGELLSDGLVLLETARMVEDALHSGIVLSKVFISHSAPPRARGILKQVPPRTAVYEIAAGIFEPLASTRSSQGILALASAPNWSERDLFSRGPALILVAAGVQDPGNLGAMIRTAEAFGATGILLTTGTASPYNAKAVRATAGSVLRIPLLRDLTPHAVVKLLAKHRMRLLAGVAGQATPISAMDFSGPLAVAIGSEGAGLPKELAVASQPFTVPLAAAVESLNAAAATAVILYEIARQRHDREKM